MIKPTLVIALMLSIASPALAQHPICVLNRVRIPRAVCTALEARNIDRIEVLKGAAAVAQYGPDGANGVISIVTKEGTVTNVGEGASDDPLARYLFPPELVMAHQQAIGLTERQRSAIQDAMRETQGEFIGLKFKLSAEVEKLQRLLEGSSVAEAKVAEQVDQVLALERRIKQAQMTLMVRVKNQLTEQQQAALGKLRE